MLTFFELFLDFKKSFEYIPVLAKVGLKKPVRLFMDYPAYQAPLIPHAFIRKRLHTLTGLWLVLFLIEHLFTNSQAALIIGDDKSGFVKAVNFLRELPYLYVIEIFLLGVPFFLHGIWGIRYLLTGEYNSFASDGSRPSLAQYPRNHAYTWQRITSWILLFGIIAHVVHMRFLELPEPAQMGPNQVYLTKVEFDKGLLELSQRMGVQLYDENKIRQTTAQLKSQNADPSLLAALEKWRLKEHQLLALSPSFGVAELLMVRETFKSSTMIFLYSIFVIAACYHAFNGLWTSMISYGITLTARAQLLMRRFTLFLMLLVTSLGLAAIWGSWYNISH